MTSPPGPHSEKERGNNNEGIIGLILLNKFERKKIMKEFWKSKTFWVNAIGLVIIVVQYFGSISIIQPEVLAGILGALNFVLRFFTSEPIGI